MSYLNEPPQPIPAPLALNFLVPQQRILSGQHPSISPGSRTTHRRAGQAGTVKVFFFFGGGTFGIYK